MNEEWRDIPGYEGFYQVSSYGRVRGLTRNRRDGRVVDGRIKSPVLRRGYLSVGLYKNNSGKMYLVHRLVAEAFIPNPDGKPQVNHINGKKDDAAVTNLEWCTSSENHLHSHRVLKRKPSHAPNKPFIGVSDTQVLEFNSLRHAGRSGFDPGSILKCINGSRTKHKGFSWMRING